LAFLLAGNFVDSAFIRSVSIVFLIFRNW